MNWGEHVLHPIWAKLLPSQLLEFEPPKELAANCLNCPKIKSAGFRPGVKCCTYHPKVPNYMLGFALQSDSKQVVERLIRNGFLTPEGSGHTPLQWLEVMRLDQSTEYGKSEKVVCDFLDRERGLCGIYQFRNSACSTYFCTFDAPWGENFWERMHHLLARCELALIQIAMQEVGFDLSAYFKRYDALSRKSPQELCHSDTRGWRSEVLQWLWGDYYQREAEFFVACANAVNTLQEPWQRIMSEKLLRANVMEISSMEPDALEDEDALVPFADVYNNLIKMMRRIEKTRK